MVTRHRARDVTFLKVALLAGAGGLGAIVFSIVTTVVSWHNGRPGSTFFFFSLWGLAALAGAAANVVTYLQSGDPPQKPPRGGQKVVALRLLEAPSKPLLEDNERKAA